MYRHNEVGHTQCDLSVTPVQHKPPPQCSRFSDHHSLCVCSCLIFHPWPLLLFSCAPSENSPFRWPIQHLLHLHCGKHFLLFQIFSQSCFGWKPGAPAGGHQPGWEYPLLFRNNKPLCETYWALCGWGRDWYLEANRSLCNWAVSWYRNGPKSLQISD